MVYQYLTGARFRHRVQAIVEKFTDMNDDLDKERKAMTRLRAKREEQLRGVIDADNDRIQKDLTAINKDSVDSSGVFTHIQDHSP